MPNFTKIERSPDFFLLIWYGMTHTGDANPRPNLDLQTLGILGLGGDLYGCVALDSSMKVIASTRDTPS